MKPEKILVLDSDIESAAILKEILNALGYTKVFMSTNREILDDLPNDLDFDFMLLDFATLEQWDRKDVFYPQAEKPSARIVLMHWEYDDRVGRWMSALHISNFMRKPFDMESVGIVLK